MDPDIVAALDDDFDYENPNNILDDDFITKANRPAGGLETEWEDSKYLKIIMSAGLTPSEQLSGEKFEDFWCLSFQFSSKDGIG